MRDRLFLYTDGLPEAINSDDEQFGFDRTLASVNSHKDLTDQDLFFAVWDEVIEFIGQENQFDDLTVVSFTFR